MAKADRCKTPKQVLTYGSPLAKRVKSNISQHIAAEKLAMRPGQKGKPYDFSMLDMDSPYRPPSTVEKTYWGGAVDAFVEYTFGGPIELMAGKSLTQAAVLTGVGTYGSLKLGIGIELGIDFALIGAFLTATDPANKWEGGADEWGFYGGNSQESLPGTMSGEEPTPFMWGLKQGHLGGFWSSIFGG